MVKRVLDNLLYLNNIQNMKYIVDKNIDNITIMLN